MNNDKDHDKLYSGMEIPEQNWFKCPHEFFSIDNITVHESILLLYVIRHTWGFHEYGIPKKITIDEFMNGRWGRNKETGEIERMDSGCRMSRGAVSKGLNRLEELGYLIVEIDDRDKARIKKSYTLKIKDGVHQVNANDTKKTQRSLKKLDHEKDTIERNNRNKKKISSSPDNSISDGDKDSESLENESIESASDESNTFSTSKEKESGDLARHARTNVPEQTSRKFASFSRSRSAAQNKDVAAPILDDKMDDKSDNNSDKSDDDEKVVKPLSPAQQRNKEWTLAYLEATGNPVPNPDKYYGSAAEMNHSTKLRKHLEEQYENRDDVIITASILTEARKYFEKETGLDNLGFQGLKKWAMKYIEEVFLKPKPKPEETYKGGRIIHVPGLKIYNPATGETLSNPDEEEYYKKLGIEKPND